jgi:hypothetical protein
VIRTFFSIIVIRTQASIREAVLFFFD